MESEKGFRTILEEANRYDDVVNLVNEFISSLKDEKRYKIRDQTFKAYITSGKRIKDGALLFLEQIKDDKINMIIYLDEFLDFVTYLKFKKCYRYAARIALGFSNIEDEMDIIRILFIITDLLNQSYSNQKLFINNALIKKEEQ